MLQTFEGATQEALEQIHEEKKVRRTDELFLLFALGSQFDHLIKLALDKMGVFCLVANPARTTVKDIQRLEPLGIILSGGPASVYADTPPFDTQIFDIGIPVLGICLGFQLWAKHIGVKVAGATKREFGIHKLTLINKHSLLFDGCDAQTPVLESHGDYIESDPKITILGFTENAPVAAARHEHLWGVQFHPEVTETEEGRLMFNNFCFSICGARDRFPAEETVKKKAEELRKKIGDKKILLALSGGSDSSVVAFLLKKALADNNDVRQVRAVYIRGIDRPDDEAHVRKFFGKEPWLELTVIDATDDFLVVLRGQTSMREKRIAMRSVYKKILENEAAAFGASFIAQGTLYTDISESGGGYESGARKAQIKLHHNTNLHFSIPELCPLDDCVKDNARDIGRSLGVPETLLTRHPFPGPGLVIRIEGEVDKNNLAIARKIDEIYISELRKWKLYETVWQAGAVVTQSRITCTKGDDASEGTVVALWAVWSVNGFTAQAADLPYGFRKHVARRITNEIREVGAVVYRDSDKPPATIEWG